MAKESIALADYWELKPGKYRAWMAPEWLGLRLREASDLLWPRLKPGSAIIDEDAHKFLSASVEYKNITAKAWHCFDGKVGVHVLLEVH